MTKSAAILVGDSHYAAIAAAAEQTLPAFNNADLSSSACLFVFNAWKYALKYGFSVPSGDIWVLNPELKDQVDVISGSFEACSIFCTFGGGHHSALSTLEHPQAYDLILPEAPNLPVQVGAELLPFGYVIDLLKDVAAPALRNLDCMRKSFPDCLCRQLESPPPNGDDAFVRDHLGSWFESAFTAEQLAKISPRYLRYKMWRAHSFMVREQCAKLGVGFEPVPVESQDEEGFLESSLFGADATHASPDYGRLVIKQIERCIGDRLDCWSSFG